MQKWVYMYAVEIFMTKKMLTEAAELKLSQTHTLDLGPQTVRGPHG